MQTPECTALLEIVACLLLAVARSICIDPLWFDAGGVLHGKASRGTPEPAPRVAPK